MLFSSSARLSLWNSYTLLYSPNLPSHHRSTALWILYQSFSIWKTNKRGHKLADLEVSIVIALSDRIVWLIFFLVRSNVEQVHHICGRLILNSVSERYSEKFRRGQESCQTAGSSYRKKDCPQLIAIKSVQNSWPNKPQIALMGRRSDCMSESLFFWGYQRCARYSSKKLSAPKKSR